MRLPQLSNIKSILAVPFYQQLSSGKVGYALLWLLGVPLPVLALFYFFRGH